MLNRLAIAMLVIALAAPGAAWLILGSPASYGNGALAEFPKFGAVFAHKMGARKRLADALLQRSPLRLRAVQTVNRILYYGFGSADNVSVLAGKDGWLFYRHDFWGGVCQPDDFFLKALNGAELAAGLAEAAGVRLIVSISPDKSSIYPEMLPRGVLETRCKAENGERWRRLAREYAPGVLDHTPELMEGKQSGVKVYFASMKSPNPGAEAWPSAGIRPTWGRCCCSASKRTSMRRISVRSASSSFSMGTLVCAGARWCSTTPSTSQPHPSLPRHFPEPR
jgi:hypothetical protein